VHYLQLQAKQQEETKVQSDNEVLFQQIEENIV